LHLCINKEEWNPDGQGAPKIPPSLAVIPLAGEFQKINKPPKKAITLAGNNFIKINEEEAE